MPTDYRKAPCKKGKWTTVWKFWGNMAIGTFDRPPNAQIKVRYGFGWFGKDRQKQRLDGMRDKYLKVSKGYSYLRPTFQVKVDYDYVVDFKVYYE